MDSDCSHVYWELQDLGCGELANWEVKMLLGNGPVYNELNFDDD